MLIQWIELYDCIGQGRDIINEFQEERRYRYGGCAARGHGGGSFSFKYEQY